MPRRKKNGQSPSRVPGRPSEGGSLGYNTGYRLPEGHHGEMANNFPSSKSLSSSDKDEIVRKMQEMFSHLDPEVIYIVLSESDFKVENAMDSLLELSVAAEVTGPITTPLSGFERTAEALLSTGHFSEHRPNPDPSKTSQYDSSPPSTNLLTDELDLLVDQELETLIAQQDVTEDHTSSQYLSSGKSISSVPPFPQQALPELLQSSLEPRSGGPSAEQLGPVGALVQHMSGPSSLLDQVSTQEEETADGQQSLVDFTHLTAEVCEDKPKPPLDLAASGRPSAFQIYKKQGTSWVMPSDAIVGGARSKVYALNQKPLGYMFSPWNLEAPVFSPRIYANQHTTFITPVAQQPSKWPSQPKLTSPSLSQSPLTKAPLKPSATIPISWAVPTVPQATTHNSRLRLEGKLLVLLRGAPGSGKSTLARALLVHNPGGVILSTDDYFTHHGRYQFEPTALGEAHEWNHIRAKEAFEKGTTPIIIDNTNMQGWEMKPYVVQALKHGYKVLFREPETWWKNKPRELGRRTSHDVPVETIRRMLSGYERFVTIQTIMGSQMPERKQRLHLENKSSKPVSCHPLCPDLVEQPRLPEREKKFCPQLFSSLPDVSSVGRSSEVGMLEDGTHKSTESLNFQPAGRSTDNDETSDSDKDIDLGDLDSELDTQLKLSHSVEGQQIPDCIVESVINDDNHGDETPVAFSESIGQRMKRERPNRSSGWDQMHPLDLVKDANQLDSKAKETEKTEKEAGGVELVNDDLGHRMPMMLDFVGDWPSEGSLKQRQVRRRERQKEEHKGEGDDLSKEANESEDALQSGPDVTLFQKLLDQAREDDIHTSSSSLSFHSPSFTEELGKEKETCGRFEEFYSSGSNSEEKDQHMNRINSSRGELPDCVLDWNLADSCKDRNPGINNQEGLKTEIKASHTTEGNGHVRVDLNSANSINPLSALSAYSLAISQAAQINVCDNKVESQNVKNEVATGPGDCGHTDMGTKNCSDNGKDTGTEADCIISDECQSPVCEGSVEADTLGVGSQERKQRHGRRSGKLCKLALTFTQNCPAFLSNTYDHLSTTAQNTDCSQNISMTELNLNPNSSHNLEPQIDLFTDSKSETKLQPHLSYLLADTGCFTQTEPQDFALLWRLNHQGSSDGTVTTVCGHSSDFTSLSVDSSRFVPELSSVSSAAFAVDPSSQTEIPYRVMHEKGTQVEERELGVTQDRLESLRILSSHFKLVSFDTLEDLYDKCHQDLDWTTNLLLDSGERFFKDEDCEEKKGLEDGAGCDVNQNISSQCRALTDLKTSMCGNVLDESQCKEPNGVPAEAEETQQSTSGTIGETNEHSGNTQVVAAPHRNKAYPDISSHIENGPQTEPDAEVDACGGSLDDAVIIEESRFEMKDEDEIASMDEVHRLLQAELEEMEREEKQSKEERTRSGHLEERRSHHLDIQSLELKLPTELALQLTELFGPVGVDPETCSVDDCAVLMDLNLAKLLHQKWKETIQERQKQAALSFHLLKESSVHWGKSQAVKPGPREQTQAERFLISADGNALQCAQPEAAGQMPFMDHWNVSHPSVHTHVSLRDIIKEEQALQETVEKARQGRVDLNRRDGATKLKENQLYSLFPAIDRHFLQDIFRDQNYSLSQTELFLRSLLDKEPVKTVVAPEAPRSNHNRAASKEREKRQRHIESILPSYQDTEDPEYDDFRAEARLQRTRQLESFTKAAEAYKQGRKEVASFYAQQGHLHGQRMREANHRAAVQIFERVNSSLLPNNILDLHGLHVDEALEHLDTVLLDKITECEQGLCQPQLSVITGRGNHSQGGVARIRPAVLDYLTNKHYRFTEPKPGLVLVSLK